MSIYSEGSSQGDPALANVSDSEDELQTAMAGQSLCSGAERRLPQRCLSLHGRPLPLRGSHALRQLQALEEAELDTFSSEMEALLRADRTYNLLGDETDAGKGPKEEQPPSGGGAGPAAGAQSAVQQVYTLYHALVPVARFDV